MVCERGGGGRGEGGPLFHEIVHQPHVVETLVR